MIRCPLYAKQFYSLLVYGPIVKIIDFYRGVHRLN